MADPFASDVPEVFLNPGELAYASGPCVIRTILGSCVAVALWDRKLRHGAMCHYLLARAPEGASFAKYGDVAIPTLLKKFRTSGSDFADLEATIAGGSLCFDSDTVFFVGDNNIAVAEEILARFGVRVVRRETGGERGRRVRLDCREKDDAMYGKLDELIAYVAKYYGENVVVAAEQRGADLNVALLGILLASGTLCAFLSAFVPSSIAKPVVRVNSELAKASVALEAASLQVSSSSQELSSGSSELASSIEEMTSSLEELQSIIEGTTKNANQAGVMSTQTYDGAKQSSDDAGGMVAAMKENDQNFRKIARILKLIDDIAFQTNILSLNAAVEAARAGEAGRGFSVVAEQVKNLAQKSAQASKDTADLLETANIGIQESMYVADGIKASADAAVAAMEKVTTLMDEVNRASREQLKGANQITQGISQINAVVQQTAASSEENAAAGEELLSQAELLRDSVADLGTIVLGRKRARKSSAARTDASRGEGGEGRGHEATKTATKAGAKATVEVVKPEDVIPLKDFSDF